MNDKIENFAEQQPAVNPVRIYATIETPPPKITLPFNRRDFVAGLLCCFLSILWVDAAFWENFQLGFVLISVLLLLLSLFYTAKKQTKFTFFSFFCAAGAFLALPVFAITDDGFSKFWLFLAAAGLGAGALAQFSGICRYGPGGFRFLYDLLEVVIVRPFSRCGVMLRSLFSAGENGKRKQYIGILAGFLCAIPALIVIFPLLISSDAAFEGLINHISLNPARIFSCCLLGAGLFLLLFSLLFSLHREGKQTENTVVKESAGVLPAAPVSAFLGVISFVYLVYLFSQLAYFSGGLSGILPDGFTLSEYARRGFFEMCILCAFNLLFGTLSVLLVRKNNRKIPLSTRIFFLFLCLFSLVLISCALGKMILYVKSLGMTRLRICTSVFMVMMAFVFLFSIIRLFRPSFSYMKAIIIAVTLLGLVTAWADIDTVIARYNTQAYFSGQLSSADVYTLSELSDGAVPSLLELAQGEDDAARQARSVLALRFQRYYTEEDGDYVLRNPLSLSSFNLKKHQAQKLLYENRELFQEELCLY